MRPRTKLQREVAGLFPKLPDLTGAQKEWLLKKCHLMKGFHCAGQTWCVNCGHVDGSPTVFEKGVKELKNYVCPHCGATLTVERSSKRKYEDRQYATIITTFGGWQVFRHFHLRYYSMKGEETRVWYAEVVQEWLNANGKIVNVALPQRGLGGGSDPWNFHEKLEIREDSRLSYYGDKYVVWTNFIYPQVRVLPILRRNGFTKEAADVAMPPSVLAKKLLYDNECEYLIKTKQYGLAHILKYRRDTTITTYRHAINIVIRNGYRIKDATMWLDYLDLLEYFHLDTHNSHYVCPKNLQKEHDNLTRRKKRIEEKRRLEQRIKEAAKWEKEYAKMKGAYFGICFGNEHIQISVITSVAAIAEEGEKMHHCVYQAGYYKRKDSLILTARDSAGNRLETIELSLRTFEIVQSRGLQNKPTPFHDDIIKLVQDNIGLIQKAKNAA